MTDFYLVFLFIASSSDKSNDIREAETTRMQDGKRQDKFVTVIIHLKKIKHYKMWNSKTTLKTFTWKDQDLGLIMLNDMQVREKV